ncbi:MAG: hypothetical protein QOK14_496, partial [Frankiaceae bacterium]|nr:hypothetical protein [Frankiaceae bacterium]
MHEIASRWEKGRERVASGMSG